MVGTVSFKGAERPGRGGHWAGAGAAYRGQGLVTEAAAAVLAWALAQPGVRRVTATIAPENLPSLAAARRLGMRQVGAREGASPAPSGCGFASTS